jgi:hypothetical protein
MKQTAIHFDDGETQADVIVGKATYAQDLQHAALVGQALQDWPDIKKASGIELYLGNARSFVVPALQAGTLSATVTAQAQTIPIVIDAATIFDLPGELIEQWIAAVYELNPRWDPFQPDEAADAREKKA